MGFGPDRAEATARLRSLAGRRLTRGGELILVAETSRSQADNKRACVERLCGLVARAVAVPKPRKRTKPTRAMIERRLEEKRQRAKKKESRRKPSKEE